MSLRLRPAGFAEVSWESAQGGLAAECGPQTAKAPTHTLPGPAPWEGRHVPCGGPGLQTDVALDGLVCV